MSVYREFICETCQERHPIPRLASDDPSNRYKAQDAYFEKLRSEHEARGCTTNGYNDVAPSGMRGNDLWYETAGYGDESHLWVKDYALFKKIDYDFSAPQS